MSRGYGLIQRCFVAGCIKGVYSLLKAALISAGYCEDNSLLRCRVHNPYYPVSSHIDNGMSFILLMKRKDNDTVLAYVPLA